MGFNSAFKGLTLEGRPPAAITAFGYCQLYVYQQAVAALPSEYFPKQVFCVRLLSQTGGRSSHPWEVNLLLPVPQGLSFVYCTAKVFKESLTVEQLKGICCTL
jgi:hypothetical protein